MYPSIRQIFAILSTCFLVAVLQCNSLQTTGAGGTGSETVIGKIIQEDGTPASETVVTMCPYDFDPDSVENRFDFRTDTTDSEGRYEIKLTSSKVTKYTLQAINLPLRTRGLITDIDISAPSESTLIDIYSLQKTGSIKVIVSDSSITGKGYVFIPGTTYLAYVENGCAIIDSVPAEMIPQVYYKSSNLSVPQSLVETVDVKAGMTTVIAFSSSAYAKKIYQNTTPDGADIQGNVLSFPLLIRLSSNNFNFTDAKADGSDLRFTKSDYVPLPFEIERWDSTAQLAEIWVVVDTIYGNDSSHYFVMYWGEAATAIALDSTNVFDTSNGYRGVWHLAEEAAGIGTKGLYKDATGWNNGDDFVSATDRSGIIGYGKAFDGIDDFIPLNSPVTNFLEGDLTIALWVNINDSGGTILSKLDTASGWNLGEMSLYFGDSTRNHDSLGVNGTRLSLVGFSNNYAIAGQSITSDTWHHLVYTWKWNGDSTGTPQYYIDGVEVGLSRDSLIIRYADNINASIRIGQPNNNESYAYFKGLMDELEISSLARSADWIKLSYMNQRKEDFGVIRLE